MYPTFSMYKTQLANFETHWIKPLNIIGGKVNNMASRKLSQSCLTERQYLQGKDHTYAVCITAGLLLRLYVTGKPYIHGKVDVYTI